LPDRRREGPLAEPRPCLSAGRLARHRALLRPVLLHLHAAAERHLDRLAVVDDGRVVPGRAAGRLDQPVRAVDRRRDHGRARLELGLFFANEMQAPLFSVRTNTASLKKFLPSLVHAYSASRRPPSMPESMRQHLQALELVPTRIEAAVEQMRGAIEILMSEGGQVSAAPDGTSSMLRCLDEAIARVPL